MDTVVVTGADRDLGRAVATGFDDADRTVVLGVSDPDAGAPFADEFAATTQVVRADPRDEFDVERLMEQASRAGDDSGIDVVAPCAAVYHGPVGRTPLDRTPYSAFDDTIRTNARGVFAAITEALPHLAPDARVLVPTGAAARDAAPGYGVFAVAAAATEAVARGFSEDREDITVATLEVGDVAGAADLDEPSVADFFAWAASQPPAELDGGRVTVADWQRATH